MTNSQHTFSPPKNTAFTANTSDNESATTDFNLETKYNQLKRKMKEITELNTAINKDYHDAKKKIRTLTFERNLLLDNIGRLEHLQNISDDSDSDLYSDLSDTEDDMEAPSVRNKVLQRMAQPHTSNSSIKKPRSNHAILNHHDTPLAFTSAPKRSKTSRLILKTRRVQPIDRDEQGHPKLPQQIGVLTVLNLGTIVTDRPNFHNERYIFPVGYTVSRTYPSMLDPNSNTVITSTIIDGGDAPRFHVVAADMPDEPIIANSATGAWTVVVRRSNEIRHREHSNSASGPDYYGFKHPTIASLIQNLPGAKDLKLYCWQTFEEMEPRAAKGVMAAAEKKRGNLEQMGNANRKVVAEEHPMNYEEEEEDEDQLAHSDHEMM